MKRVTGALITGVAAANLVACASEAASPHDPTVKTAFDDISKYWAGRGFSLMSTTKLVSIGEDEYFACPGADGASEDILTNDEGIASYCAGPKNKTNTVTVSLGSYKTLVERASAKGLTEKTVAQIVVAHELGHGTQSNTKPLYGSSPELEQNADCRARLAIDDVYPGSNAIDNADEFYSVLDESGTHGTAAERIAAFNSGADGTC